MASSPRPPTLTDVAHHASVSLATASRVLSKSAYPVAPGTRARVEQAAAQLGYTRDHHLGLTEPRRMIGLIVGAVTDPYFAEIARGVEDYALRAGYLTVVCSADRNPSTEVGYLKLLRRQPADAVVFAGGAFTSAHDAMRLREDVKRAQEEGIMVLCLADRGIDDVPIITGDNRAMLYDLTTYMISLGHKRIVYLGGPAGFTTSELRLHGFVQAMHDAGLDSSRVYRAGFDYEAGRRATARLLQDKHPDAIIAFNDESALGVLKVLRDAGIRVGEDISVAGVDDTRDAEIVDLTSVAAPMYQLGAAAARAIVQRSHAPALPPLTVLPHRVVPRSTTGLLVKHPDSQTSLGMLAEGQPHAEPTLDSVLGDDRVP